MSDIKPFAFVLMPFDAEFDDIYKLGIKSTAEELGVIAERVDEQQFSETILERVYRQIENCDFIIADMTGRNANVFYEVGYAHAKGKLCALITQSAADIPFDLKHHTHVIYNGKIVDLVEKLRPKISWLVSEARKLKEDRLAVSHKADAGFLDKKEYRHVGSFDLEITIRNISDRRSPEIEAYYIITRREWILSINGIDCAYDNFVKDKSRQLRRHLIDPNLRRLSPTAFSKIKPKLTRDLWWRHTGDEMKETYSSKGKITMEIVTSEGTLEFEMSVDVEFDEIPF